MSKKFCNFRVKYQESSIKFENFAYLQSIENKCKQIKLFKQAINQHVKLKWASKVLYRPRLQLVEK